MIVPRQSVPIDTSSPADVVSPLWHAMQVPPVVNRDASALAFAAARRGHLAGDLLDSHHGGDEPDRRGGRHHAPHHFHPSKNPPSNQSHSR